MSRDHDTDPIVSNGPDTAQARTGATHEEILAAKVPVQEAQQPDPMLQLSVGRLRAGGVALAALVAAVILGVVLYGLNSPAPSAQSAAAPAAAPATAAGGTPAAAKPPAQPNSNNGHG